MPDAFDPYFKWLGIPKADQPPHAYRILGIELFESDADVISNAADGRMAQLKTYQTGKFQDVSQKLLNEIATAKVCLLNAEKKSAYDRRLRDRLERKAAANAGAEQEELPEAIPVEDDSPAGFAFLTGAAAGAKLSATRPAAEPKGPAWLVPAAVGAGALALVVGIGAYVYPLLAAGGKNKTADAQTVLLADADRAAQPGLPPRSSSDKPAATSDSGSKLTAGATVTLDRAEASVAPRTPAAPLPASKPTTATKPKSEVVAEPETPVSETPVSGDPSAVKTDDHDTDHMLAAGPPAEPEKRAKKPPIPEREKYQAMKGKILKLFQDEFTQAKTAEAKLALAAKLDKLGDASQDSVECYCLWKIAGDGASAGGDFSKAMETIDKIEARFDCDGEAMKADLLGAGVARTTLSAEASHDLCEAALKLAAVAVAREDFDAAERFSKIATSAVRRTKDPLYSREIIARDHEIEHLKSRYAVVAKAMETLSGDADNAEANLAVGQWQCFAKGNWERGSPYLAKGSREDLAALARKEMARPTAAKDQVALADAWWALAEKDHGQTKAAFQARAVHWCEQALPKLTGLEKMRVEKLIASITTTASNGSRPAAEIRGHGVLQKGNVALASNGTTVEGATKDSTIMLGDEIMTARATWAPAPCEFTVTFDKVYLLQQIRFLFYLDLAYPYAVLVSRDGRKYDGLEDHSTETLKGWQDIRFSPRPIKAVRIVCPSKGVVFEISKFEAYCFPTTVVGGPNGRARRQGK